MTEQQRIARRKAEIAKGNLEPGSYPRVASGQWVQPIRRGYRAACCDCGLTHEFEFRIHEGRVQFRAWRNNRATAALRRTRHRGQKPVQ